MKSRDRIQRTAEMQIAVEEMQEAGDNIGVGLGWYEAAGLTQVGVEAVCRILGDDLGRYTEANGIRRRFGLKPVKYKAGKAGQR